MITLKNALEMMIQRMDERYTVPIPYWLFRIIPSLFMQEPLLMEWASCVFPMSYLVRVAEIASPSHKNHIPASAFLTFLMGVPVRGRGQHLHQLRWKDEKIKRVEALRRGLADLEMVDEEAIRQTEPVSHATNAAPSYGSRALHNGLVGSHHQVGIDNDYYWLHATSLSIRMQVEILRRAMDEAKLSIIGRVIETAATRVHPLLSNNIDREEGRYGGSRAHSLHTIQTRTSISGIEILRSMDMVNLLIAPDANIGPLDWVIHQVSGEFVSSGTPQPIESTTWRTIISTLGASWQDQGCLSCHGDCEVEKCLGIKTTNDEKPPSKNPNDQSIR